MEETTEFSFVLKPSEHGVGVFAMHDIKAGTRLRLFGDNGIGEDVERKREEVPKYFQQFCVNKGDVLLCPSDFGAMSVGWFLNHSLNPNAYHQGDAFFAAHNILSGEEILIDYNTLGEPDSAKEDFYKK